MARPALVSVALALVCIAPALAQAPRPGAQPSVPQNRPRPVQVMTMSGPWPDGGAVPLQYTQAGDEISPALNWSQVPDGTTHFVLVVHDLDALVAGGQDDVLHWLVWNIPGTATGLPQGVPQGPTREDGSRQISATGPTYRGPGAPASGSPHHYVFELYALDAPITVPSTVQSPAETRAAVMSGMSGHIRAKAAYVGLFKRP